MRVRNKDDYTKLEKEREQKASSLKMSVWLGSY